MILPPALPWKIRTGPERLILVFCAASMFVGAPLLWSANVTGFPVPRCPWKCATGLPCAGCGGTRAVTLLLRGDLPAAFATNPGAVTAVMAVALLALYASMVLFLRLEPVRPAFLRGRFLRSAVIAALGANWIYLLLAGRV